MTKKDFDKIIRENSVPMAAPNGDASLAQSLLSNPNNVTLWRIYRPEQENNIFTNGYSAEYFGDGEGSYHGEGVYAFYSIKGVLGRLGSNEGKLGSRVMKCVLLGGFSDFIILDSPVAQRYYGSDDIRTQAEKLFDDETVRKEFVTAYVNAVHGYKLLPPNSRTGFISKALVEYFKRLGMTNPKLRNGLHSGKARGIVYNGTNDHFATVIFNAKEVIPIAVSNDKVSHDGRDFPHWQVKVTKQLMDNIEKVKDFASYGERLMARGLIKNYTKMPPQNDCIKVVLKNGKQSMYNIVDDEFISDYGFDKCLGWESYHTKGGNDVQILPVEVNGSVYYLKRNPKSGEYCFFKKASEPMPYMTVTEYDRNGLKKPKMNEDHEKFLGMYGAGNYLNVYHRTASRADMEAIFAKGFTQEFTGRNANAAGPGIYITFSPKDSYAETRDYGQYMMELKLRDGINGFLVPAGATINGKTYDTPLIKQLLYLTDPKFREEMGMKYKAICDNNSTSGLYKTLVSSGDINKTNVRGIIYRYGSVWAGVVADWSSAIPFRWSTDDGKTWHIGLQNSGVDFMKKYPNLKFKLRKLIAHGIIKDTFGNTLNNMTANQQFVNGYARVILTKGGKISFYSLEDDKLISERGFDTAINADMIEQDGEQFPIIPVKIEGRDYIVFREEDGQYMLYVNEERMVALRDKAGTIVTTDMYDTLKNRR